MSENFFYSAGIRMVFPNHGVIDGFVIELNQKIKMSIHESYTYMDYFIHVLLFSESPMLLVWYKLSDSH